MLRIAGKISYTEEFKDADTKRGRIFNERYRAMIEM